MANNLLTFSMIQIFMDFALKSPINNGPSLAWVMAWHRMGNESLPEPVMTQVADAYLSHQALFG